MQANPEAQRLLAYSPRLAYAVAIGLPLVPYPFRIVGTFEDSGQPDPLEELLPSTDLDRDVLIEGIDVDIQTPNFATGGGDGADVMKPQADFYYDETSGIQARLTSRGLFGRQFDYQALKTLPRLVSESRPWCIPLDNKLLCDLQVTTALPSAGTVVTLSFLARTAPKDAIFRMSIIKIFDCLCELGFDVEAARALWCDLPGR